MVQWTSPAFEENIGIVNTDMIFLLLGLYGWEYFQTLGVEYAVIRGRFAFRWSLVPFLVGRVFLFVFLLLSALSTSPQLASFDCLRAAISITVSGDIALGCASTNLMIRTWVIWKDSRLVHTLLLIFALGHWIILALDLANFQRTENGGRCGINILRPAVNAAVFMYSLSYDFVVLVLSIAKLSSQRSKSSLVKRLRAQGILYFIVAVLTYIPPTVFSFLGVTMMVSVTGISALTASTIASCRAVRSLLVLHHDESAPITEESTENEIALSTQIPVSVTVPTSNF